MGRDFNGLLVVMAMLGNSDLEDEQNGVCHRRGAFRAGGCAPEADGRVVRRFQPQIEEGLAVSR